MQSTQQSYHLHDATRRAQWDWCGCGCAWMRAISSITDVHCATSLPHWSSIEFEECVKPDDRSTETCRHWQHYQTVHKHWYPQQQVSISSRVRRRCMTSRTPTSQDHPWRFHATIACRRCSRLSDAKFAYVYRCVRVCLSISAYATVRRSLLASWLATGHSTEPTLSSAIPTKPL